MTILPYDLNDPSERSKFQSEIENNLTKDQAVHRQYRPEWDDAEDRLNENVTPFGFTEDHSGKFAQDNDHRNRIQEVKEYVSVPRARQNHESILGNFTTLRRRLTIQARHPRGRNIAKVYSERVKYIEDSEMVPEMIYFPAMDNAFSKGLHWIKVGYNPAANKLRGKFDIDEISCRDVLIDHGSKGAYFSKATRLTQVFSLSRDQAKARFRGMPLYKDSTFSVDNEYDLMYNRSTDSNMYTEDKATFYEYQFVRPTQVYYMGKPGSQDVEEITDAEFNEFSNTPEFKDLVFAGDMEDRYYIALYNRSQGVFHLQENPLGMFSLIPLINIQSEARLYPFGDVKFYAKLADLLNVLVTVFLDNAKKANTPIIAVDPDVMAEYGVELKHAARHGGPAPGATNIVYAQAINQGLVMLVPMVTSWIQDVTSQHAASMGELPAKQIAKETVDKLIAKDRQSHGRKDVMLRYCLTQFAKIVVRMINLMEDQPGYFSAIDPKPGDMEFIPINQTWGEQEYLAKLSELAQIPPPPSEEEMPMYLEALQRIRRKFEEDNDVVQTTVSGFVVDGLEMTPQKLRLLIQKAELSLEEFTQLYKPVSANIKQYQVNHLSQDVDFKVTYGIDDDFENDKSFKSNRAMMLNERGAMARLDMLKEMGIMNAEQIIENADSENQMMQIAKALAASPDVMQYVQQLLANPEAVKQLSGATNGKAPEKKPKAQPVEAE